METNGRLSPVHSNFTRTAWDIREGQRRGRGSQVEREGIGGMFDRETERHTREKRESDKGERDNTVGNKKGRKRIRKQTTSDARRMGKQSREARVFPSIFYLSENDTHVQHTEVQLAALH